MHTQSLPVWSIRLIQINTYRARLSRLQHSEQQPGGPAGLGLRGYQGPQSQWASGAQPEAPAPHKRERMHAGNLANRPHETSCAQKQLPMRVCYLVGAGCRALAPVTAAGTAVLLKQFSIK